MTKTNYPCDLHCHTTRSDGNDTPAELIENAVSLGMHAIAITDHDIIPPLEIEGEDAVAYAAKKGVWLIPGYEFSCDKLVDDIHICGYQMQWNHPELLAEVEAAANSKTDAYHQLCDILTREGMPVDWEEDVLKVTLPDGKTIQRKPEEVQRKYIFEAIAARGHAPSWSDAKIMVRDNPVLNNKRRKIDPFAAIDLIHKAGGVAVLAHPYLIDEKIAADAQAEGRPATRHEYILQLFEAGLDGIEARYTYNKTSYSGTLTPEEVEQEVRTLYADHTSFFSAGSDYHADAKKFDDPEANAAKIRLLGERGLTIEEFEKLPF